MTATTLRQFPAFRLNVGDVVRLPGRRTDSQVTHIGLRVRLDDMDHPRLAIVTRDFLSNGHPGGLRREAVVGQTEMIRAAR